MRILVVGSGGREHALAWKLAQEAEVFAAPGNPGIAEVATCLPSPASDFPAILDICRSKEIDLVVVGPEAPLIDGIADFLADQGVLVFGPRKADAALEGSKAFSKALMKEAGVPTAGFSTFENPGDALSYVQAQFEAGRQVVVKASGNALGKGVAVCPTLEEAVEAIEEMMVDRAFGDAGTTVVIEERLIGPEFSLLTICGGRGDFYSLPVSQDYKRALDGDRGPNTGGMGTYSPAPWVSRELISEAEARIVSPVLARLPSYRGVLYSGVLVQDGQPYCLEFNVRFGDPETQSVMRRLGPGFADLLLAAACSEPLSPVSVLDLAAVSIVLASGGYPGEYSKGHPIYIPDHLPQGVEVFHAGTVSRNGRLETNGGRVLAVSAIGDSVAGARENAYLACEKIEFEGKFFRRDIAGP